jgi:hypothetical protein
MAIYILFHYLFLKLLTPSDSELLTPFPFSFCYILPPLTYHLGQILYREQT